MKSYISRFKNLSFYQKLYSVLLFILIISILPILYMGLFSHPVGDDYNYGMNAHLAWEQTGSVFSVLKAAVETAEIEWHGYQGPFASAFFMALQPAVISERLYCLTPFIMLFMLIVATSVFLYVVLVKCFQISKIQYKITTCILLLLSIEVLDTPSEAFFWYCGAVHYVFMHSCMLLLFSVLLLAFLAKRHSLIYMLLSLPLAVCSGGGNFVTALLTMVLLVFSFFALLIFRKRENLLLFIPTFFTAGAAFFLNVTAPGNFVRGADIVSNLPPAKAIYYAFQYGLTYIGKWTNIYLFSAILLLIPITWSAAAHLSIKLRFPGLFTFFSYCIFSSMFTPITYALGTAYTFGRTLNIIMQTYYLLLILNLFYWSGWLKQTLQAFSSESFEHVFGLFHLLFQTYRKKFVIFLGLFLLFSIFITDERSLTTKSALHDLGKGYAQTYHRETLNRIALLSMEGVDEVWIPNYTVRPWLLDFEDITTDPEHWRNKGLASWYKKKIVHLSVIY